ncbi:MAG: hypothetical protein ISS66_00360 [Desulfobacteraceae bacterium]|nr:hypothetical protein [Desulfobacteraceae bacterium]
MAEQSTSTGRKKNKALKEDDFARKNIAPNDGISKSSFFEAISTRGFSHILANVILCTKKLLTYYDERLAQESFTFKDGPIFK